MPRNKTSCTCSKCRTACEQNPGWFAPEQAERAVAAGLSGRLMLDYYIGGEEDGGTVLVLSPASAGYEGWRAPNTQEMGGFFAGALGMLSPKGPCVFFKGGACALHATNYKPKQCREVFVCRDEGPDLKDMMVLWRTDAARALVRRWMEEVDMDVDIVLEECT